MRSKNSDADISGKDFSFGICFAAVILRKRLTGDEKEDSKKYFVFHGK
jgi:hypothetical protein